MKPIIKNVLAVLLLPIACVAQDWRNADSQFKPKPNRASSIAVSWWTVQNVQAACEAESKRRGLGGFGYGIHACSFWTASQCTIVTSAKPTMHQLGHELRHCYEHRFH